MSVIIVDISTTTFTMNGIAYLKNFQSLVSGDSIRIVNVYDSRLEILANTLYSDFTVDGSTYGSSASLQAALVDILFYRAGIDGGGTTPPAEPTVITWEALVALGTRSALDQYLITGSADPTKDYGKVQLTDQDVFPWVNANKETETIIIN